MKKTIITAMPDATMIENDKGISLKLHNVGVPDTKHSWLDLDGFRERGELVIGFGDKSKIKYGTVVATSIQVGTTNSLKYVGYVVQIRRRDGAFGTDEYYIRHPDGLLMRHSNQMFYVLCPKDAETVLNNSEYKPEEEGGDVPYSKGEGKEPKSGFDIPYNEN